MYDILYHTLVVKNDIPALSRTDKQRVKTAIQEKLTTRPEIFGAPLSRSLKGHRRLRVGNHRVVFRIDKKTVKVFYIGHRSIAYKEAVKRVGKQI